MERSFSDHYRQKADEARQHLERSAAPYVRQMWHDIAQQYEYLAEHIRQQYREELPPSGRP
jgi:hypothetical protein